MRRVQGETGENRLLEGLFVTVITVLSLLPLVFGLAFIFATSTVMNFVVAAVTIVAPVAGVGLLASLLVGVPLAMFKKTKDAAGIIFAIASFLMIVSLFLSSSILVYSAWGRLGVILSAFTGPFLIPLGLIAMALEGRWMVVGSQLMSVVLLFALFGGQVWASRRVRNQHQVTQTI